MITRHSNLITHSHEIFRISSRDFCLIYLRMVPIQNGLVNIIESNVKMLILMQNKITFLSIESVVKTLLTIEIDKFFCFISREKLHIYEWKVTVHHEVGVVVFLLKGPEPVQDIHQWDTKSVHTHLINSTIFVCVWSFEWMESFVLNFMVLCIKHCYNWVICLL